MIRPRAVWLDRDGTLNAKAPEGEYVVHPADVRLLAGAGDAVARLNRAGIRVAVVTNQRGIGLGRMSEHDLVAIHQRLRDLLADASAHVDAIVYCPHAAGTCQCRKPAAGLLYQAGELVGVAPKADTVTIGDSESDVAAGRAAGTRTIRLADADVVTKADMRCKSLAEAVDRLLAA